MLLAPTPADWLPRVLADVDTLLLDHAHCEKKAASSVLGFVFRAPELELAGTLSRLAREELGHFELVLRELRRRGLPFVRLPPARYAEALAGRVRRKTVETAMLDGLVVAALIEARSHERLLLLADGAPSPELRDFFAGFAVAEERHAGLLLDLAATFGDPAPRVAELAAWEAELVVTGEPLVRMHS